MQKQALNSNNLKKLRYCFEPEIGKQQRMKMQLDADAISSL
jgi:hypothetical protein